MRRDAASISRRWASTSTSPARSGRFRSAGSNWSRSPGSSFPGRPSSCSTNRPPRFPVRRQSGSLPQCSELKARGASLVFISHFLEDVLAVSDRVTVLKNSRKVATLPNQGLTKHHLIQLMIGRDAETLAESYEGGVMLPAPSTADRFWRSRGSVWPGSFSDVSFDVRPGEILGIFGNLGAGMTEVARVLFGRERPTLGRCGSKGNQLRRRKPRRRRTGYRLSLREPARDDLSSPRDLSRTSPWLISIGSSAAHSSIARSGYRGRFGQADGRAAAESGYGGGKPERWQPAESRAGEVADSAAEGADFERADARDGRRRQARGARSD